METKIGLILCAFFLTSCLATSKQVAGLQEEVSQLHFKVNQLQQEYNKISDPISTLQPKLDDMQRNQADLSTKMDTLNENITILNEKLDDNKNRMSLLSQRMDDIQSNLGQRMDSFSRYLSSATISVAPMPSEIWRLAYGDYNRGKYDLAIVGFRTYLNKYPRGELAPNCQDYLADCYFIKKDAETAIAELDKLIKEYSYSDLVPGAKLKKSSALIELNKTDEAKLLLQSIIDEHPHSPEAKQAKEKIESLSVSE